MREIQLEESYLIGSGKHGVMYNVFFKEKWCTAKLLLKKLLKPYQSTENLVTEFSKKCTICLVLDQSNLVKFVKVTQIGNEVAIINETIEMNLSAYIKQKGNNFSLDDQVSLCLDMAKGLSELHYHSILHKNLHDGNVLVQGNRAKISDFYYSLLQLAEDNKDFAVPYVAPEVIKDSLSVFVNSSDIYSLGVLLLQVVASITERTSLEQMVNTVSKSVTKEYKQRFPIVLYGLIDHIIYRCLSIDIKNRPSGAEICEHFEGAPQYVSSRALHQVGYTVVILVKVAIFPVYLGCLATL